MTRSSAPPPIPSSHNGLYALLGLLLLGGTGAIVYFKFIKKDPPTVAQVLPPPPSASASAAAPENTAIFDVPPPTKIYQKPDGGPAGAPGGSVVGTAAVPAGGCDSPCKGADTPELASAVRGRISIARGCYGRALNTDSTLQGKVGVSLRISPTGSVCSAGITSTTLNSPAVEQCALAALRNGAYPAPNGGCKDVGATIVFAPGK